MKRTPLKRKSPLKSKSRLSNRSKKMKDSYDGYGGRRDVVSALMYEVSSCEAGMIIGGEIDRWVNCAYTPCDVHEILPRSAGGSIVERSNLLVVCRFCHMWIHANPKRSRELGLLASRYGKNGD